MPLLLNPLINSVFNCPNPTNSPIKKIFEKLKDRNFVLLVPRTSILLQFEDSESGISLDELCYTYDFVASHIVFIDEPVIRKDATALHDTDCQFKTFNNRELMIRQNYCVTMNGYDSKRRCKILDTELVMNFNDYLKGSDNFSILYIDFPLTNTWVPKENMLCLLGNKMHKSTGNIDQESGPLDPDVFQRSKLSFQHIIRIHSVWAQNFETYFKQYRQISVSKGPSLDVFNEIVVKSFQVMKKEKIFQSIPNLYELIHDHIESHLYPDIWFKLKSFFEGKSFEIENSEYLSLDALETELYPEKFENFQLKDITKVERCLQNATVTFKKIEDTKCHSEKSQILIETLQELTGSESDSKKNLPIDADTLMNLFLLVVCRSNVPNLYCHFYYLQKFTKDENNIKFGVLGYAMSTFEATLFFCSEFHDSSHYKEQNKKAEKVKEFIGMITNETKNSLIPIKQFKDCLRYRNKRGESILALCAKHRKNESLFDILINYEDIFPLEDILDDRDIEGSTLLIISLRAGNLEAAKMFINILKSSCSHNELIKYFNNLDIYNRTAAHYLTNEIDIVKDIGSYLNWKVKDLKGYTPIFTIFRSYDQSNYNDMVRAAFYEMLEWYNKRNEIFQFSYHNDNSGNSLLHILKSDISILLKYNSININIPNYKDITPLVTYVKYNRTENIKSMIEDPRLILDRLQQDTFLSCFDFAKNSTILHELGQKYAKVSLYGIFAAHTVKYESSNWVIYSTIKDSEVSEYKTIVISIKSLHNLLRILMKLHKMDFLPYEELLVSLSEIMKGNSIISIQRLNTKNCLNFLTNCISVILLSKKVSPDVFSDEIKLMLWIKAQNKKIKAVNNGSDIRSLGPDDLKSIKSFAQFNLDALAEVKTNLNVLRKLSIFLRMKSNDLKEAYNIFSGSGLHFQVNEIGNLFQDLEVPVFHNSSTKSSDVLSQEIIFLEKCTNKFHMNLDVLIRHKLLYWWRGYTTLLDLKKMYSTNFSNLDEEREIYNNSNIFNRYALSRKNDAEKNMAAEIIEQSNKLDLLGSEIWHIHENLAEELNSYLKFKTTFFKNIINRIWVPTHIALLKDRLLIIEDKKNGLKKF